MSASLKRQPVAQGSGGLFSTQKVSFSAETQKLLKGQSQYFVHSPTVCQRLQSMNELFTCTYERLFLSMPMTNKSSNTNREEFHSQLCPCSVVMMEESKLTNFQQRQLREKMQSKFSLETRRNL